MQEFESAFLLKKVQVKSIMVKEIKQEKIKTIFKRITFFLRQEQEGWNNIKSSHV
jgi:hypothetical protein